jgi:hypothetical protein
MIERKWFVQVRFTTSFITTREIGNIGLGTENIDTKRGRGRIKRQH